MNRELKYLVLTKVGFFISISPFVYMVFSDYKFRIPFAVLLLLFLGTAMWGYGYGRLYEIGRENEGN